MYIHNTQYSLLDTIKDYCCHNPSPSPSSKSKVISQKSKRLGVTLFWCALDFEIVASNSSFLLFSKKVSTCNNTDMRMFMFKWDRQLYQQTISDVQNLIDKAPFKIIFDIHW